MTAWLKDVIGYGTHAARPSAGSAGALYYETDTNTLFRDNGSTWDGLTVGAAGALTKISEVVVPSGGAATIAFSSIPGTYRTLHIVGQARGDTSATFVHQLMQCNGDTAANYDDAAIFGAASASGGASDIASTSMDLGNIVAATSPANAASSVTITIPNYAGTTFHKSVQGLVEDIRNTSTGYFLEGFGGRWRSTAAISSILIFPASGNFVQGTVYSLYGLS